MNLRSRILDVLAAGPMTNAQLASLLGAKRHYVIRLTTELKQDGVVRAAGNVPRGTGKGGRPHVFLALA
jgi:DNA-binding IclR family transcriptional regulator